MFVSVPLLFEVGFESMFDKIILVTTDENTRLERLMKRDKLDQDEALKRINSQMSEKEKIKKSDFIIKNDSNLKNIKSGVEDILNKL